jgi:hypothetical protein
MSKKSLLLAAIIVVFSGCYDSLTEAELCNPNFENCSQYESNSSSSGGSSGSNDIGFTGNPDAWDDHGYEAENSPKECKDGDDNDGDGYIDCEDSDCEYTDPCQAVAFEGDESTCSDGIDNDSDGYVDCDDFSCEETSPCEFSSGEGTSAPAGTVSMGGDCTQVSDCKIGFCQTFTTHEGSSQSLCTSNCYGSCNFNLLCLTMSDEKDYCVPKSFSPCGKQTCDMGEACWSQNDCSFGDCINVTGGGAPNHPFCSVECSEENSCFPGFECIPLSSGSSWCIP